MTGRVLFISNESNLPFSVTYRFEGNEVGERSHLSSKENMRICPQLPTRPNKTVYDIDNRCTRVFFRICQLVQGGGPFLAIDDSTALLDHEVLLDPSKPNPYITIKGALDKAPGLNPVLSKMPSWHRSEIQVTFKNCQLNTRGPNIYDRDSNTDAAQTPSERHQNSIDAGPKTDLIKLSSTLDKLMREGHLLGEDAQKMMATVATEDSLFRQKSKL